MNFIRISWRNLWRNPRRTLITASSVFFGVIFAITYTSVQEGSFGNMIDNIVRFHTGYLNIKQKDFRKTRSLNDSFIITPGLDSLLQQPEITQIAGRIESFALASSGGNTFPALVIGIEPEKEESFSHVSKWITDGHFLTSGSKGAVLGEDLATNLHLTVGDTLILISQGYRGTSSAGIFPVSGIAHFPTPDLNKQLIYLDLQTCQSFFNAPKLVTSMVIMVRNHNAVDPVFAKIQPHLPKNLSLYTWSDLNKGLVEFIEGKKAAGKVVSGLLFMIIAFGILSTLIMLVDERMREMGIMMALGMRRMRLSLMIFTETLLMGLVGVFIGFAVMFPIIHRFVSHPVALTGSMRDTFTQMGFEPVIIFSEQFRIFLDPALVVFYIMLFLSLYIFYAVFRIKETKAINE